MNAKRLPRRGEVSKETVHRLLDMLQEMQYRMMKMTGGNESMMYFEEMRMPIKRLCMELDSPELYERFMMRNEKFFSEKYIIENDEKK
jgi:hypothetical protein